VLYSTYGQHAFLGMTVISAAGLLALLTLARLWTGELLVGAKPA
jgi:PPP family 3-phenylpropionic acid transporter